MIEGALIQQIQKDVFIIKVFRALLLRIFFTNYFLVLLLKNEGENESMSNFKLTAGIICKQPSSYVCNC